MKTMLTGANGFVGKELVTKILNSGRHLLPVSRNSDLFNGVCIGQIDGSTDWHTALDSCDVVLHLAARAHVMHENSFDSLPIYRRVNTDGTLNLALQAAESGVRRFVFVSSIKVNGERTSIGNPFKHDGLPNPLDAYGVSKYEAELGLRKIANETGMEVVIVRPPLIYGPGVKGNFATMLSCLRRGIPLPLASVTQNRRSLVAIDNLVDLLVICIDHPAAANQTFLVSDGEDLSTAELLNRLSSAMGRPSNLLPFPPYLLKIGAKLLGKSDMAQRVFDNLQVDISHTCQTLQWEPPISVNDGLRRAVMGH